jgi:hypothetical protein
VFQVIEKRKLTRSEGPFERGKGLKETRPLWPPQRGVGLQEPNLGKTNPRVTLLICLRFVFHPLADSIIFLTLTRLVVVINFVNFSFALFTPPLGDYQYAMLRSYLPVAKGTIVSTKPSTTVGGQIFGRQYSEVIVTCMLKRDTVLHRPCANVESMADAYMMSVAWPYKKVIVYILSCLCLDLYEPST